MIQLPTILKEEEDEAYSNEAGADVNDDIINNQHNAAVRTIAIGHIVDKVKIISFKIHCNFSSKTTIILKKQYSMGISHW